MNYQKIYESLIQKARKRKISCYTEKHHVVPRCMGGTDCLDNIVALTPEEHYVAHQLLVKIFPESHALAKAASMMTVKRPGNKLYGWLKRYHANAMSVSQKGSGNSQHGTKWVFNYELKTSKRIPAQDPIPEGWQPGRKLSFVDHSKFCTSCGAKFLGKGKTCSHYCKIKNIDFENSVKAYQLFEQFVESDHDSLTQFSKQVGLSQPGLTKLFRKHIIEYADTVEHGKSTPKSTLKELLKLRPCSSVG